MDTEAEIKKLLKECEDRYRLFNKQPENLEAARQAWEDLLKDSASAESGEVCRFAMLAAFKQSRVAEGELWRVRALSRFLRSDSRIGVSLTIMSWAFAANDVIKEGEAEWNHVLSILDEMERYLQLAEQRESDPERVENGYRLLHEKRGLFHVKANDLAKAEAE